MRASPPDGVVLRDGTADDERFIFSSWLQSFQTSAFARQVRHGTYFRRHHDVVEEILGRRAARVRVAALRDEPFVILGWAVTEPRTLHYVYVKEAWRGRGIGLALVAELETYPRIAYSHRTSLVERLVRTHLHDATFDPYLTHPAKEQQP